MSRVGAGLVWIALALTLVGAASCRKTGRCKTNADCGWRQFCEYGGGPCGTMAAGNCTPFSGCAAGEICVARGCMSGVCVKACSKDAECGADERCDGHACESAWGECASRDRPIVR